MNEKEALALPGMGYWKVDPYPTHLMARDTTEEERALHARRVQEEVLKYKYRIAGLAGRDLDAVLTYMKMSEGGIQWRGHAGCRLCPSMKELGVTNTRDYPGHLGSRCMVTPDGKWRFPEKWEHYITEHGLVPTEHQFILDAWAWYRGIARVEGSNTQKLLTPSDLFPMPKDKLGELRAAVQAYELEYNRENIFIPALDEAAEKMFRLARGEDS